jgi:hypothetical protein
MRTLLLDPALQERTQASRDDGSWVVLEADESRQGEKTAESSREPGDYKLFCDTHKILTYVFSTFPLALPSRADSSSGGSLHTILSPAAQLSYLMVTDVNSILSRQLFYPPSPRHLQINCPYYRLLALGLLKT